MASAIRLDVAATISETRAPTARRAATSRPTSSVPSQCSGDGGWLRWKVIESIQAETALKVDFGGGVKTEEEVEELLELGIDQINIGSMALQHPETFSGWINKYGSENFILSADVKNERIQLTGWTEATEVTIRILYKRTSHMNIHTILDR